MAMAELFKFRNMVKKMSSDAELLPPQEAIQNIAAKTVVYKIYSVKVKRIMTVKSETIEKCLSLIWNKITYIATVVSEQIAKNISTITLKNAEVILLPTYLGRCTAEI